MTIAIVDDTTRDRELLKGMLAHYFSSYGTDTEIHEFRSGEEFFESLQAKALCRHIFRYLHGRDHRYGRRRPGL